METDLLTIYNSLRYLWLGINETQIQSYKNHKNGQSYYSPFTLREGWAWCMKKELVHLVSVDKGIVSKQFQLTEKGKEYCRGIIFH